MASPGRPTNTGFDTEFGGPLKKWRDWLTSQGIQTNIISGVRSPQEHQMAWDNFLAGRAGRPLPHPEFGPVSRATPPGATSTHDVGLGADVQPVNPADLPKMYASAPKFGLTFQGPGDRYHFNLANWQQALATQPQMTAWDQSNPANVPTRMAMNMEADGSATQPGRPVSATPIPGGGSHADFIRSYAQSVGVDPNLALGIANAEGLRAWSAKNPNAASAIDVQNGQPFSFGDFQLNVRNGLGTQALKAGIDPRDPSQWQAADKFAIDQLKAGGAGPWKGDPFAKQYLATGKVPPVPAMPGMNLNTVPTAVAGGSPLATALSGAGKALGGGGDAAGAPATPQSPLTKALSSAGKTLGGGGDAGGGSADDKPPDLPPLQLAPPMATGGPMMMGAGGQNNFARSAAENFLAQQGFQTQPSLQYGGANALPPPVPAMGLGEVTGIPGLPGTTLNSPSQLQMALMMGQWPYQGQQQDPYGGMNYG